MAIFGRHERGPQGDDVGGHMASVGDQGEGALMMPATSSTTKNIAMSPKETASRHRYRAPACPVSWPPS